MDRFVIKKKSEPKVIKYDLDETSWVSQSRLPDGMKYDFDTLWNIKPEELGQVMMYGKLVSTPRWIQSYGKSYRFSGTDHAAKELPAEFKPFLIWAKSLGYGDYNQVLVNHYIGPSHHISAHSDDESQLVKNSPIISISLGAQRRFVIRRKSDKQIVRELEMPDRSYVVMGGSMQKRYTHEVPKITRKGIPAVDKRINITFRQFID